jgi:hypothetical protein
MKKFLSLLTILLLITVSCSLHSLHSTEEYEVFGDSKIKAQIFENRKTIDGNETKQLIVNFKDINFPKFITIAIPPKLIGLPENLGRIKIINNKLIISEESLKFTPINDGPFLQIESTIVSDSIIVFSSFGDLKKYGKKIIIRKVN